MGTYLVGCTAQERAKSFGGQVRVDLPKGRKLVAATWKNSDLWYLTRPFKDGEEPTDYEFTESSSFGIMEGNVSFHESR